MSENKKRPLNESIHCSCGVIYISGYTHCPSCGKVNPNDNITNKQVAGKTPSTLSTQILQE